MKSLLITKQKHQRRQGKAGTPSGEAISPGWPVPWHGQRTPRSQSQGPGGPSAERGATKPHSSKAGPEGGGQPGPPLWPPPCNYPNQFIPSFPAPQTCPSTCPSTLCSSPQQVGGQGPRFSTTTGSRDTARVAFPGPHSHPPSITPRPGQGRVPRNTGDSGKRRAGITEDAGRGREEGGKGTVASASMGRARTRRGSPRSPGQQEPAAVHQHTCGLCLLLRICGSFRGGWRETVHPRQ